jgi:two-component sensor histidine kinase
MLNKKNYISLKERYLYGVMITVIFLSSISAVLRFHMNDYIIVAGDFTMILFLLYIATNYEKKRDFYFAVIQIFWLSNIILFLFIISYNFGLSILLVILMPLLASVLLETKHFFFHIAIFLLIFIAIMSYGFINKTQYPYMNDINFLIIFGILFIFVLVHSTMYNTSMQQSYDALQKSNKQKSFLLNEIHHRVKNNLNIVASILGLETFESDIEEVHELIHKNKLRIESIAMVHEILYESSDLEYINIQNYIQKLTKYILNTDTTQNIHINLNILQLNLSIESMIQFGIIINELITNSIKYAFPHNQGEISIILEKRIPGYVLTYKDNGIGFTSNKKGFGSSLIEMSALQLEAKITTFASPGDGVIYEIYFQEENHEYINS